MAKGKQQDVPSPETAMAVREEPKSASLTTFDYGSDAGAGFEDATSQDFVIPIMSILQKMSPQVDKDDGKYIKGAEAGMIINSATQEMFDGKQGVGFIPVHREHRFLEWVPRDQGGGLVGVFTPEDPKVLKAKAAAGRQFGKLSTDDSNDLIETFSVFGLVVKEDGTYEHVVVPFASTNIKQYKRFMTKANAIQVRDSTGRRVTPPMFAHKYRLRSAFQSNKKGTWHSWSVDFDGAHAEACRLAPDDELYAAAKAFRDVVVAGKVTVNREAAGNDSDLAGDTDEM